MERRESQERLEGRHRGTAAVEPERELVEVVLQVLVADAVTGTAGPRLESAEDTMTAGRGRWRR
jgi:hypothetical protein